jgi:hypothetical protein
MASTADLRYAFNRGEIGKKALSRVDRDAMRLAASTCLNWMPLPQGPMMLRPGTAYLGATKSNGAAKLLPFVFSRTDTALIELTHLNMRLWIDDELVTRPNITTQIVNGTFSTSAGWLLNATDGATATISGGVLLLTAEARGSSASARQVVNVPSGSRNVEHALRITVTRGPILCKVGSNTGTDDYIKRTKLGTGTHSLAFTPGSRFVVEFENLDRVQRKVTSCTLEDNQTLELTTIWRTTDFDKLQFIQSGDVVYVACDGKAPKKIERRNTTSWSVVDYEGMLGPLRALKPREDNISLRSTVYEGNGYLVASAPLFLSEHIGSVVRVFPTGQTRRTELAGDGVYTDAIRVSGIQQERDFSISVSGTWKGTLVIQQSLEGNDIGFTNAARNVINAAPAITKNGTYVIADAELNANKIVWYRVGFTDTSYSSGVAVVSFSGNGTSGGGDSKETAATSGDSASKKSGTAAYARITSVSSSTIAAIEVLKPFGSLTKTKNWLMGEWNGDDGYPSSVTLFDGRLWWGGKDRIWGSVSDDYENFDHDFEGEAGPISRSLGSGPVDTIAWMLALSRLMVGRGAAVSSVRSSNFDEPLTPTNFTIKDATTRGAAAAMPGQVDSRGVYIHANGRQLFELLYRVETQDYTAADLTQFHTDIGLEGFSRLAVARSPDTRIFVVRDDGQLCVVLREQDGDAQLAAWWRMSTGVNDLFEDVCVLPDDIEDRVYVVVRRGTNRYIEAFARRDECIGEPETKCLDSHLVYSGAATRTITGLSHLNGETVRVWGSASASADTGIDLGTYVVSGGSVGLLPISVTTAVVGLPYTATFVSAKLGYGAGLSIGTIKRIDQISFVLMDTHAKGLEFGQDLTFMDPMVSVEEGEDVDEDTIWDEFDKKVTSFPGRWDSDTRLCLRAASPRPVTVGAVMITVDTSARTN